MIISQGSDIAAGTAAALAAGSIAFKEKGDTAYSDQLLSAAKSLYAFAKAHRYKSIYIYSFFMTV